MCYANKVWLIGSYSLTTWGGEDNDINSLHQEPGGVQILLKVFYLVTREGERDPKWFTKQNRTENIINLPLLIAFTFQFLNTIWRNITFTALTFCEGLVMAMVIDSGSFVIYNASLPSQCT